MLIYFLSAITSLIFIFTLYFALWLASQGIAQFHHDGMERVRRYNEREVKK